MLVYMSRLDCVAFNSIHVVASVSMQFEATRFVPRLVFEEVGPVHKTTLYFKLLLTRVVRFPAPDNLNILTLERLVLDPTSELYESQEQFGSKWYCIFNY